MNKVLISILIVLLIFSCKNSHSDETKENDAIKIFSIPQNSIPIVKTGYVFITGIVDNVSGNFLLDTGSDRLFIDSTFHVSNSLKKGIPFSVRFTSMDRDQKIIMIRDSISFSSGSIKFRTSRTPVLDLKSIGGDFIDGLLGINYFNQRVLEINYERQYLNVYESIDSVDISDFILVSLIRKNGFFYVPISVKVNDSLTIKGDFILDTGSPGSTFTSATAQKFNLEKKIKHKSGYYLKYGGIAGGVTGFDFIADSLKISNFGLSNVNMSYRGDTSGYLANDEYLGIIGNNILDRFYLIIDFKNLNLYLKPNESFEIPFTPDRLGFSFVDRCKTKGGWIVAGISFNSAAERQGLKIDDKIILINEIPVETMYGEDEADFFKGLNKIKLTIERSGKVKLIEFDLVPIL